MIPDTTEATVEVTHSNLVDTWWAILLSSETGTELAWGNGRTRATALRDLADAIEDKV